MELARHKREDSFLLVVCVLLIATAFGLRLGMLRVHRFDPDEFEHLHAAWLLSRGHLPYCDFFEHHTPGFYFLLQPLFGLFDAATSTTQALALISSARHLMWLLTGVILLLTFVLGRLWRQGRAGLLGTALLGSIIMFLQKTLEIRPDVPAAACWMGCLALLLHGVRRDPAAGCTRWLFGGSGILLGLALMTTQKVLFALPGFALAMAWHLLDRRSPGSLRARGGNIACQVAGFAVPVALTLGYFTLRDGLHEFLEFNLLLNLRWKTHFGPGECLRRLLVPNPIIAALGLIGLGRTVWGMCDSAGFRRGDFVPALNTLGLVIGLFVIPVPRQQYLLLFLPMLALFAADALLGIISLMTALRDRGMFARRFAWLLGWAGVAALVTGCIVWRAFGTLSDPLHVYARISLALLAFSLASILVHYRHEDLALAAVILLLCLEPLAQMRFLFRQRNHKQLAALRYVLEHTAPDETVMDGWQGVGVFRPHAYFYWMLHEETRAMLTTEQKRHLLENLRCGTVAPVLVNLDGDLRGLSPEVTAFLEETYVPVGVGSIRIRMKESPPALPESEPLRRRSEIPAIE